ncbi:Leucine Rich Repeat protein [Gimesia alba]|uniref:Leucine Rich Repeat protein n=1 Tax=Gimesia alba TaxID=2527973 RepID=A0A517R9H7_9PLAN|nr:hypothetical protein [Gimesia alba]QDT40546.1 Leucine Rich Repeat protein [Gimesia alba]
MNSTTLNNKDQLSAGMKCYELEIPGSEVTHLPDDIQVEYRINLDGCRKLKTLPDGLKTGTLILAGCTGLTQLPENLDVCFLNISDCPQLTAWPQQGRIRFGNLIARNCTNLKALPDWLTRISQLDISGCTSLTSLPEQLQISSWIDIAHTGITELPESIDESQLRWRGVPINQRIAFHPEEIMSEEILSEPNSELRRVMLERVGFDRFFKSVEAEVLDTDQDPGGKRELLKVPLEGDEDLVCVSVNCPSTDRRYIIRVPPDMKTCAQAIAWTAGFDDPDDYHPLVET